MELSFRYGPPPSLHIIIIIIPVSTKLGTITYSISARIFSLAFGTSKESISPPRISRLCCSSRRTPLRHSTGPTTSTFETKKINTDTFHITVRIFLNGIWYKMGSIFTPLIKKLFCFQLTQQRHSLMDTTSALYVRGLRFKFLL